MAKQHLADAMSSYLDYISSISSIESSSRRERKYSEERLSQQATIIQSLSYAVQRLADTLETKEAELQTKEAELKMTNRVDVDLEGRVLDLMIENAELKNQVVDLKEAGTVQDPSGFHNRNDLRTPTTYDDFSSFQREAILEGRHCEKENSENVAYENNVVRSSNAMQANKPAVLVRRSSGPILSKMMPKKLGNLKSGLGGRSLLTNLEGKRILWGKGGGVFPKLIPRRISTFNYAKDFPDDLSDLSSM